VSPRQAAWEQAVLSQPGREWLVARLALPAKHLAPRVQLVLEGSRQAPWWRVMPGQVSRRAPV